MKKIKTAQIEYNKILLTIKYTIDNGTFTHEFGTEQVSRIDLDSVYIKDIDITKLFSDKQIYELEDLIEL
jgi:hypothetical protein